MKETSNFKHLTYRNMDKQGYRTALPQKSKSNFCASYNNLAKTKSFEAKTHSRRNCTSNMFAFLDV